MYFVLFHIATGSTIKSYESESDARKAMRDANGNAGWKRLTQSWVDGYECEYCTNGKGSGYGPYGITEYERWAIKFDPKNKYNEKRSAH